MAESDRIAAVLHTFGTLRPQGPEDWNGPFTPPPSLVTFYKNVGPASLEIPAYGNGFFLPALAEVWKYQEGYRWHALSQRPIVGWDEDWLVVADQGSDPFVLSRSTEHVLHAVHGAGAWVPRKMFANISTMAAGLGTLGVIVRDAGDDLLDDTFAIAPRWRAKLETALSPLVGGSAAAKVTLNQLGW